MHTDYAVLTGTHHTATATPCQDYCFAQTRPNRAWAVVADGCSTGGETDLGARAWAGGAKALLEQADGLLPPELDIQAALLQAAEPFLAPLAVADGYATLGMLEAQGKRVRATFFGDGVLLARHSDGTLTFINIQYDANAPFYLNYQRHPELLEAWQNGYPGQERHVLVNKLDENGDLLSFKMHREPALSGPFQYEAHIDKDDLELVLIGTDGATSCGETLFSAVRELAGVKNSTGEFLRRRVAKLARQWQKTQQLPTDDLAIAGIWLGEEMNHG